MSGIFYAQTAIFPAGETESEEVDALGVPAVLYIPSGFTTSDITFLIRKDGQSSYGNALKTVDGTVTIAGVVAGDTIQLDSNTFSGTQIFKVVTSVAQVSAVNIPISFTPIFGNYLN